MTRLLTRSLLLAAGFSALIAPGAFAQGVTVCVFPAKELRGINADSALDVKALTKELAARASGGASFAVVPVTDAGPKDIDAEAERRHCTDIVTTWRMELTPDSPSYGGTLGHTQVTTNKDNALMLKDTLRDNGVLLQYSMRKANSKKAIAHGESDSDSAYATFAAAIVKKLGP